MIKKMVVCSLLLLLLIIGSNGYAQDNTGPWNCGCGSHQPDYNMDEEYYDCDIVFKLYCMVWGSSSTPGCGNVHSLKSGYCSSFWNIVPSFISYWNSQGAGPCYVYCGYRCPVENYYTSGSDKDSSPHMYGDAADIYVGSSWQSYVISNDTYCGWIKATGSLGNTIHCEY